MSVFSIWSLVACFISILRCLFDLCLYFTYPFIEKFLKDPTTSSICCIFPQGVSRQQEGLSGKTQGAGLRTTPPQEPVLRPRAGGPGLRAECWRQGPNPQRRLSTPRGDGLHSSQNSHAYSLWRRVQPSVPGQEGSVEFTVTPSPFSKEHKVSQS